MYQLMCGAHMSRYMPCMACVAEVIDGLLPHTTGKARLSDTGSDRLGRVVTGYDPIETGLGYRTLTSTTRVTLLVHASVCVAVFVIQSVLAHEPPSPTRSNWQTLQMAHKCSFKLRVPVSKLR